MSVWSNIAYPIAGFASGDPMFALCMSLLGISSAYSHKTHDWIWDWMGMYLVFAYLILHDLPVTFALCAPIALYAVKVFDLMSYAVVGVMWAIVWAMTGFDASVALYFGIAIVIRQIGQVTEYEFLHSLWHVLSAIGLLEMRHALG